MDQYYQEPYILPLGSSICPDDLLEALLISLLTGAVLKVHSLPQLKGKGSSHLFRAVFEGLFRRGKIHEGFVQMRKLGLLKFYLPELMDLEHVDHDKDYHPEGDALDHVLECLKYYSGKNLVLGWSVILHDLGKAVSFKRVSLVKYTPSSGNLGKS